MNKLSNDMSPNSAGKGTDHAEQANVFRLVCFLLMAFLLTACASFPAYQVPKVDNFSVDQARPSDKPSVYIPLKFLVDLSDGQNPGYEFNAPLPKLKQAVEKTATEAALFHDITFESFQAQNTNYVLQIEISDSGNMGKAIGAGFITGASLFLIPSAATDKYNLTANLYDADGQLLKSYSYDDKITTWFGIWFLPMAGHTPENAAVGVCENMMRALFRDLSKDGLLAMPEQQ